MYIDKHFEQFISITIQVLKRRDSRAIQVLKNVLTYFPSPTYGKQILEGAIVQLSETCPETTCWLLQHPDFLQPELNTVEIITHHLSYALTSLGLESNQDFHFTTEGQLVVSQSTREMLLSHFSNLNLSSNQVATLSVIQAWLMHCSKEQK